MPDTDFTSLNNIGVLNITVYLVVCVILFMVCFNVNNNNSFKIYFFVTTFFIQLGVNIYLISALNCPNTLIIATLNTLFPWIFILLLSIVLIDNIPGWLRIFSNTTGMYLALNWYSSLLDDLKSEAPPENKNTQLLSEILFKPQIILNEIDILGNTSLQQDTLYRETLSKLHENIFTVGKGTSGLNQEKKTFKNDDGLPIDMSDREYKILSILNLKNNIGYFMWYSLIGLIASIVSINSSINTECN
jgi:hypothetical protein